MKNKFRPKFHFTPKVGYMNDPNGLIYNRKTKHYHLFYQYCADLDMMNEDEYFGSWVEKNWGHAISKDLIHWEEKEPVLAKDRIGNIWSGTCAIDRGNTFGVFPEESDPEDRFVCSYACANNEPIKGYGKISCCLGYSIDGGDEWKKYANNPVIANENNHFDEAFGDPKIFWLEEENNPNGGVWVMITVLKVRIFTSSNLRDWEFQSVASIKGEPFYSECPDIFMVTVGKNKKWVYSGAGKYYIIGDFVRDDSGKLTFVAESEKIDVSIGNLYATQHFYNLPNERIIQISWMGDHSSLDFKKEGKTWDGAQSIPIELTVEKSECQNDKYLLKFNPAKELEQMREEKVLAIENKTYEGEVSDFNGVCLQTFDLDAIFDVSQTDEFCLKFRKGDGEYTKLTYTKSKGEVEVNTYFSGRLIHEHHHLPFDKKDGKLSLRVLCDTTILDVFVQNGESYKSMMFFPSEQSNGFSMNVKGVLKIEKLDLYKV